METETGDYGPSGVLPIDEAPSRAARGPRYRLTWFRDGVKEVAKQDIYPYATAGPVVYTFPSSRRALISSSAASRLSLTCGRDGVGPRPLT